MKMTSVCRNLPTFADDNSEVRLHLGKKRAFCTRFALTLQTRGQVDTSQTFERLELHISAFRTGFEYLQKSYLYRSNT